MGRPCRPAKSLEKRNTLVHSARPLPFFRRRGGATDFCSCFCCVSVAAAEECVAAWGRRGGRGGGGGMIVSFMTRVSSDKKETFLLGGNEVSLIG